MNNGILIIALGYPIYGSYAYNMAISLKSYDSDIRVCILYEPSAIKHLDAKELSFFDIKIQIPEEEYTLNGVKQYQRVKLLAYKYSPFDFTMYMDADNFFFPAKKPSWLLGELINKEFTIGMNGEYCAKTGHKTKHNYTYWGDPGKTCAYWKITGHMPQVVSGFYSFHKTENNKKLFDTALMVYDDPKAPTTEWANGKADEYCFNVAMGLLNMRQAPYHILYFDKLNGIKPKEDIYREFWGLAIGGNKVSQKIVLLYNQLVHKASQIKGMTSRHYHQDKIDLIPERKKY